MGQVGVPEPEMMTMRYTIYKTDRTVEEVFTDKPMELVKMQQIVGGHIEFTTAIDAATGEQMALCVNEEGLLLSLKSNPFLRGIVGNVIRGRMAQGEEGMDFIGH